MAVAHVVGGLSLDQGRVFRSHLLECTSCRARVGELRAIAHNLADVERDERRLRTAKRTETKAHDGDDETPVPPSPRLSGRATLLMAAGLLILMALSAWNFVLRGRLQQTEEMVTLLGESVGVLQDGQSWPVAQSPRPGVQGQVNTLGQDMVLMVDGLEARDYGIYLLGPDDQAIHSVLVEATNGMIYWYIRDSSVVEGAERVVLTETDQITREEPSGATVFEAARSDTSVEAATQPVVGPGG